MPAHRFLMAQTFNRRQVETFQVCGVLLQLAHHRELEDHGLAGGCRRGHYHVSGILCDRGVALLLDLVESVEVEEF